MKRHIAYLTYLFKHKWFVFIAGRKLGVGYWRLLVHDWQKFTPYEWRGYAKTFYTVEGKARAYDKDNEDLKYAWNHHQKHCKHHWMYWLLIDDKRPMEPLRIPEKYLREMVADWFGAGRAIWGKWEAHEWYERTKHNFIIHPESRKEIEKLVDIIKKLV